MAGHDYSEGAAHALSDPARLILRWSIPGSVGVLLFAVFARLPLLLPAFRVRPEAADSLGINTALAILASIPIGFIVYQLYYRTYTQPLRVFGDVVCSDRSREIADRVQGVKNQLKEIVPDINWDEDMAELEANSLKPLRFLFRSAPLRLAKNLRNRAGRERYAERVTRGFGAIRYLAGMTCHERGLGWLYSEAQGQIDIYHTLGACRIATALAFLSHSLTLLVHAASARSWVSIGVGLIVIVLEFGLFLLAWRVLSRVRHHVRLAAVDKFVWILGGKTVGQTLTSTSPS